MLNKVSSPTISNIGKQTTFTTIFKRVLRSGFGAASMFMHLNVFSTSAYVLSEMSKYMAKALSMEMARPGGMASLAQKFLTQTTSSTGRFYSLQIMQQILKLKAYISRTRHAGRPLWYGPRMSSSMMFILTPCRKTHRYVFDDN